MTNKVYEALVIGGGLCGLSTLYHLKRLGCKSLALIEQFSAGHTHGSSHGTSRITRSSYDKDYYVRLMQVAHNEEWPRLETDCGQKLIYPTPGCLWGPENGPVSDYAKAVQSVGINIDFISAPDARKRMPMISFEDSDAAIIDPTCGLIAAANTLQALLKLSNSADTFFETKVSDINTQSSPIEVHTNRGTLKTNHLIVTAGAWAGRLIPELAPHLTVIRQTVGYFEMEGQSSAYTHRNFPVWVYLEDHGNEHFYGLPQFQCPGIKVARHVTSGLADNPDDEAHADASKVEDLKDFIQRKLTSSIKRTHAIEHCLYTNTASTDYILDTHPHNPKIAIGAGFSGHGFKLGPLSGRVLAELVLYQKTSIPEFESCRGAFMIPMSGS